jgi:hypothetical protein
MALSGTSALARVAMNPGCEIQVAMMRARDPEPVFYRRVTGEEYDREFGERISARRRGSKFEHNLHQNDGAQLRQALAAFIGVASDRIFVRNLEDEVPGVREAVRIARYQRTRDIIADAVVGRLHAQLVIHPELMLPVPGTNAGYVWVEPDFMVWDGSRQIFVPGDEKSFVVQENDVDPGDLERTRLQIGAQIIGLRDAYARHGLGDRIANRGLLIFATPYGLRPHEPRLEQLDGAVHAVEQAIEAIKRHGAKIDRLRAKDGAAMHVLVSELEPHFQEKCMSTCLLARRCRQRYAGRALDLGDAAADLLGAETDLVRLADLMAGAAPRDPSEATTARELQRIAGLLGLMGKAA